MTDFTYQGPIDHATTDSHQQVFQFNGLPGQISQPCQPLSSESSLTDLRYRFNVQDPNMIPKSNRTRKKSSQGSEQNKHRRTRSGCYTCRSRRVKCDEIHPICERCKKGGRECVYPDISTSTKQGSNSPPQTIQAGAQGSPGSSWDEYEDGLERTPLEATPSEDEIHKMMAANFGTAPKSNAHCSSVSQHMGGQNNTAGKGSETSPPGLDIGASPTPSTEGSVGYLSYQVFGTSRLGTTSSPSVISTNLRIDWSQLPPDLQFYLAYFYQNLTHLHYSLKFDPGNVLKTTFLDAALRNEALLYALVGFSAFQRTLHNSEGKIQDFLQYYNKAVSLLLESLRKGERHNVGTLLAILQLATIEEFLGDWINLLGHQKAAYEILTELYTPQTIMENEMSRVILGWYLRFDALASLMTGSEMVLDREWPSYAQDFFEQKVSRESTNLNWKIELVFAQLRLIAMDMSTVFAKNGKEGITHGQLFEEIEAIGKRIEAWKTQMDPSLQDSRYLVTDFSGAPAFDPDDIVNPYMPGVIYGGPLWVMNVAAIDWHSISLMHLYQTALTIKTQPSRELCLKAYASCQLFESVELWPGSPPGTVLALQSSLGISCSFLPRDQRHSMWARRKLATIESNGYIYPYTFRTKMSEIFRDRSCIDWWLPNDEGYPPIIRSIRKFVEERSSPAIDLPGEDLRDMKQIFASLKLDDARSRLPPFVFKEQGVIPEVAIVGSQTGWAASHLEPGNMQDVGWLNLAEGGAYGLHAGQGPRGLDQNDSAHRLPQRGFPQGG